MERERKGNRLRLSGALTQNDERRHGSGGLDNGLYVDTNFCRIANLSTIGLIEPTRPLSINEKMERPLEGAP